MLTAVGIPPFTEGRTSIEKHFNKPLLDNDTESTYMQRLGFLKYYDCGIGQIIF
nr:MAG TPA: hypothetical protein [Caudoviricetes sp.]